MTQVPLEHVKPAQQSQSFAHDPEPPRLQHTVPVPQFPASQMSEQHWRSSLHVVLAAWQVVDDVVELDELEVLDDVEEVEPADPHWTLVEKLDAGGQLEPQA